MKVIKTGDVVELLECSQFFDDNYFGSNPPNIFGLVVETQNSGRLPIEVFWMNGTKNSYDNCDLKVVCSTDKYDLNTISEAIRMIHGV